MMGKSKSLHTTDAEQLKARLPNSVVVEGKTSKFWLPERQDQSGWYC